ncbi:hypothetical protein [Mycolicibacterium sp.]|uniref:hypothetical protein n=1 Tax=Mycolicibacterium sp. TaxID=2320850 RepID=UPI00355FA089
MSDMREGTRVRWFAEKSTSVGTVVDGAPDRRGLITVKWDGIGTYKEDPIHLRRIHEVARPAEPPL